MAKNLGSGVILDGCDIEVIDFPLARSVYSDAFGVGTFMIAHDSSMAFLEASS